MVNFPTISFIVWGGCFLLFKRVFPSTSSTPTLVMRCQRSQGRYGNPINPFKNRWGKSTIFFWCSWDAEDVPRIRVIVLDFDDYNNNPALKKYPNLRAQQQWKEYFSSGGGWSLIISEHLKIAKLMQVSMEYTIVTLREFFFSIFSMFCPMDIPDNIVVVEIKRES